MAPGILDFFFFFIYPRRRLSEKLYMYLVKVYNTINVIERYHTGLFNEYGRLHEGFDLR